MTDALHLRAQQAAIQLGPRSALARIRPEKRGAVLERIARKVFQSPSPTQAALDAMPNSNIEWVAQELLSDFPNLFFSEAERPRTRDELRKMTNWQRHDEANKRALAEAEVTKGGVK